MKRGGAPLSPSAQHPGNFSWVEQSFSLAYHGGQGSGKSLSIEMQYLCVCVFWWFPNLRNPSNYPKLGMINGTRILGTPHVFADCSFFLDIAVSSLNIQHVRVFFPVPSEGYNPRFFFKVGCMVHSKGVADMVSTNSATLLRARRRQGDTDRCRSTCCQFLVRYTTSNINIELELQLWDPFLSNHWVHSGNRNQQCLRS